MPRPSFSSVHRLSVLAFLSGWMACSGWAQPVGDELEAPLPPRPIQLSSGRLRYGLSFRHGYEQDLGPGFNYSGYTQNDLEGRAEYFGTRWWGAGVTGQHEAFSVLDPNGKVTGGGLFRLGVGPMARVQWGPLKGQLLLGYQLAQLPIFGNTALPPAQSVVTRQAALASAQLDIRLPWELVGEIQGNYPLPLSVRDRSGVKGGSGGFSAGASLLVPVGAVGRLTYGLRLEYQYSTDRVTIGPTTAVQYLSRVGMALDVDWLSAPPPPPPPKYGTLHLLVLDADSRSPLGGATVSWTAAKSSGSQVVGPDGSLDVPELKPGEVAVVAQAGGHLPAEASTRIVAGKSSPLEVLVKKEPPKVGAIAIIAMDKETGEAIPGLTVKVGGHELKGSASGTASLDGVTPGLTPLTAAAPGYTPANEVVSVVANKTARVQLQMVKVARKLLATITGVVRSTEGGAPVPASLEIPQARVKTTASAQGSFTFRLPGGTFSVIISAPGYLTQTKSVTVRDGDQAIFNVNLHPSK